MKDGFDVGFTIGNLGKLGEIEGFSLLKDGLKDALVDYPNFVMMNQQCHIDQMCGNTKKT